MCISVKQKEAVLKSVLIIAAAAAAVVVVVVVVVVAVAVVVVVVVLIVVVAVAIVLPVTCYVISWTKLFLGFSRNEFLYFFLQRTLQTIDSIFKIGSVIFVM